MTPLLGHDAAVAAFRAGFATDRIPHAWLIAGPHGIGKATFAKKAAVRILADAAGPPIPSPDLDVPDDHPTARLFAATSHADYRLVKREVWAGNRPNEYIVPESDRSTDDKPARGIRIEQVRMLGRALTMRPSLSDRRVIVIDSADDFEPQAANALLKMLEEPPAGTIFLLVSHAPERLLATIRSRCRLLRLKPLDDAAMRAALEAALPDAAAEEIAALVAAGDGAPGRAVAFRGLEIGALDAAMDELIREGDPTNARRSALSRGLALKAAQPRYEAFLARAPSAIAAAARTRRGPALAEALIQWEKARDLATAAPRLSLDPESTAFELAGMLAALGPRR